MFDDIVVEAIAETMVSTERNPDLALAKGVNIVNIIISKHNENREKMILDVTTKINNKYKEFMSRLP